MRLRLLKAQGARPLRFAIAGAINSALSYGSYVLMLAVGADLPLAGLVSLLLGMAAGYLTHGHFVFGHAGRASAVRFVGAWGALYFVHLGIVSGLRELGIAPYLGALVALIVLTVLSYTVLRVVVFVPPQTNSR